MRQHFKTTAPTPMTLGRLAASFLCLGLLGQLGCQGNAGKSNRDDDDRGGEGGETGQDDDPTMDPPDVQLPSECEDVALSSGGALVRRLTHLELRNTIRDVLGVDLGDHHKLPGLQEPGTGLFSNDAVTVLKVDGPQVNGYNQIAMDLARKVSDWGAFARKHTDCTDFQSACTQGFVQNLGMRMFRRPLTDGESQRYAALFDLAEKEGDGFGVGANLVVQSMLQSPNFLYRIEAETPKGEPLRRLNGFEMASRLSYLIWGSAPDDALYADAKAGRLSDREVLLGHVQRLIDDPKAEDIFETFGSDWLGLHELPGLAFDSEYYADANDGTIAAMLEETRSFVRGLWRDNDPISAMFTSQRTTVSEGLAKVYGFDAKPGVQTYDLAGDDTRSGVLTQAAFLGLHGQVSRASNQPEPSLVERGKFVLENIFCAVVPPPPDDVVNSDLIKTDGKSERGLAEDRANTPRCAGCHSSLDPFGLALAPYDNLGRKRDKDVYGNDLRGDGVLVHPITGDETDFTNVREFGALLGKDAHVRRCMVQKGLQFAIGKRLQVVDDMAQSCFVDSVNGRLTSQDASFKDVFAAIAAHPMFGVVGHAE